MAQWSAILTSREVLYVAANLDTVTFTCQANLTDAFPQAIWYGDRHYNRLSPALTAALENFWEQRDIQHGKRLFAVYESRVKLAEIAQRIAASTADASRIAKARAQFAEDTAKVEAEEKALVEEGDKLTRAGQGLIPLLTWATANLDPAALAAARVSPSPIAKAFFQPELDDKIPFASTTLIRRTRSYVTEEFYA